ncbi:hypothetical protein DNI29_22160 [Hymenobacter sediminis]|uniref:hypothetical protein n=1 Tax=Hymenobacter sediminis TaxID=2218621 RepID=UPI000F50CFE8|nr:hypothetical protein [Hymenobacter sediminis]RPD44104.1 hypothetical protein DNI29_22160 [Hymenobacter sediminis]
MMPLLRSLLLGLLTFCGLLLLFAASDIELYTDYLAGLPGLPKVYSYTALVIICRLSWAWVVLSIVISYVWHTRRLDRTTRLGLVADALMLLQYACWLVLAVVLELHLFWRPLGLSR